MRLVTVNMASPADDTKRALVRALEQRVVTGPGSASPELRARAFENRDLAAPLGALIEKVAKRSFQVTDGDVAAARAAGYTEDQLFELIVCAAVGESSRQYQAGLAALAESSG